MLIKDFSLQLKENQTGGITQQFRITTYLNHFQIDLPIGVTPMK